MKRTAVLTAAAATLLSAGTPKNVILMISDGWGIRTIEATNIYQAGKPRDVQNFESFPVKWNMATYSGEKGHGFVADSAVSDVTYIKRKPVDSAASGSALSTGFATYNAAICYSVDSVKLANISDVAETAGKSSGVVSTVQISHATPASMAAHNKSRNNYEQLGKEMLTSTGLDVIIGAGHPLYTDNGVKGLNLDTNKVKDKIPDVQDYRYVGGQATWESLVAGTLSNKEGVWSFTDDSLTLSKIATGTTAAPTRLAGVLPVYTTAHQLRTKTADGVFATPLNKGVANLATCSQAALNVLKANTKGFFLMIEGGAVDWAGHANQLDRIIEEQIDFNGAVDSVINWIEKNSSWDSTLLIVTGDHETGYLTGPAGIDSATNKIDMLIVNNGKGVLPGAKFNSGDHTNQLIPLFAKGAGSELIKPTVDNSKSILGNYIHTSDVGQILTGFVASNSTEIAAFDRVKSGKALYAGLSGNTIRFSRPVDAGAQFALFNMKGAIISSGKMNGFTAPLDQNLAAGVFLWKVTEGSMVHSGSIQIK